MKHISAYLITKLGDQGEMSKLKLKFWLFYYDWAYALLKDDKGTGINWTYNPHMPETKDLDALSRIHDFRLVTESVCGITQKETISYLPATYAHLDKEELLSKMPLTRDQQIVMDIVTRSNCTDSFDHLRTHVMSAYPFNSPTIYTELDLVVLASEARNIPDLQSN
ncbi:hypothetical protein LMH73_006215 [Vibrio splendidus]|nr:hypothetical protein [Vibrio splendidus]MCC4880747.1 hypothetical protein [Vibrio splendidus]